MLKDASNKYYNEGNLPSENEILHHILNSQKSKLKLSSFLYENLTDLYKSAKVHGDSHKKRLDKLNSKYAIDSKISEQNSSELVSVLILLSQYKKPAA